MQLHMSTIISNKKVYELEIEKYKYSMTKNSVSDEVWVLKKSDLVEYNRRWAVDKF